MLLCMCRVLNVTASLITSEKEQLCKKELSPFWRFKMMVKDCLSQKIFSHVSAEVCVRHCSRLSHISSILFPRKLGRWRMTSAACGSLDPYIEDLFSLSKDMGGTPNIFIWPSTTFPHSQRQFIEEVLETNSSSYSSQIHLHFQLQSTTVRLRRCNVSTACVEGSNIGVSCACSFCSSMYGIWILNPYLSVKMLSMS